jgi:hypothetical protein
MIERRAEPRLLCSDLIHLRLAGAERADLTANLEDISPSGACVLVEEPLPIGTAVCLVCHQCQFSGQVRYCIHNEIGYFAGIRFDAGQKWSREEYEPAHLLDPAVLGR